MRIALDKTLVHQTSFNRSQGAFHPGVARRQEPDNRHQQQARIQLRGTVALHKRVLGGVESARAIFLVNLGSQSFPSIDRPGQTKLLRRFYGTNHGPPST
jgi:hypothetical protein